MGATEQEGRHIVGSNAGYFVAKTGVFLRRALMTSYSEQLELWHELDSATLEEQEVGGAVNISRAGVIVANMLRLFLEETCSRPWRFEGSHGFEDTGPSQAEAGSHLHSTINDGPGEEPQREHGAAVCLEG